MSRIAMLGPFGFHPNKTMRSRALGLARPLVGRGHRVKLFMPPWHTPEEADKTWREDGVAIRYVPLRGGTIGITLRLVREVMAWEPDVVHGFKPKAYSGLAAWWLWYVHRAGAAHASLRVVTDMDDWEGWGGWNELAPYSTAQKYFFAWQERWGMHHCHRLTVASRALETLALGHGVPPERIVYVPNGPGIETKKAGELEGERESERRRLGLGERPTLLVYSRLFEFDTARLVAVLKGVQERLSGVAILFVGAGLYAEDTADLRRQLEAAGLMAAVVDVGWVEEAQLPAVLSAADVGLYLMNDTLLNRTKCPVKLADMVSLGIPVVGERVGQVPEYVLPGQTGCLRPVGDVAGLVADAVTLLENADMRRRFACRTRAHAEAHFTWERPAEHLESAYLET